MAQYNNDYNTALLEWESHWVLMGVRGIFARGRRG
jgi:hypothetical protein